MADIEQAGAKDTTSSLIDQLGYAFLELEAHKDASKDKVRWMEVEEHFRNLETLLKNKFEELQAKEKEFEEKEAETHSLIAEKVAAVNAKEQALLDRVQELKDAAVTAIAEARANHLPTSVEPVDDGDSKDKMLLSY
ncbi:hypothetical protein F2P56_013854 [Juglans regia]|uniref:Uncharacterized protein n=1 Tax=Juglans regia TaxID=51240 RepID=A0A833XCI6_JUGRE|nr:hypothetical protein F2P56_013854 [Juglans regia]